jgi:hypothetical protein
MHSEVTEESAKKMASGEIPLKRNEDFAPKPVAGIPSTKFIEDSGAKNTVMMLFPHRVLLTTNDRQRVEFLAGAQSVPNELADHPYLKAHGVTRYEPKVQDTKGPTLPGGAPVSADQAQAGTSAVAAVTKVQDNQNNVVTRGGGADIKPNTVTKRKVG